MKTFIDILKSEPNFETIRAEFRAAFSSAPARRIRSLLVKHASPYAHPFISDARQDAYARGRQDIVAAIALLSGDIEEAKSATNKS